jgi:hypothetical protein
MLRLIDLHEQKIHQTAKVKERAFLKEIDLPEQKTLKTIDLPEQKIRPTLLPKKQKTHREIGQQDKISKSRIDPLVLILNRGIVPLEQMGQTTIPIQQRTQIIKRVINDRISPELLGIVPQGKIQLSSTKDQDLQDKMEITDLRLTLIPRPQNQKINAIHYSGILPLPNRLPAWLMDCTKIIFAK